jgi:hypothetical protein
MNIPNTISRRSRQRLIALVLTLALGVSAVDAVAGPTRDGAVHDESNVEAESHRTALRHGHHHDGGTFVTVTSAGHFNAPQSAGAQRPETDLDHLAGGDHCAHLHGFALAQMVAMTFSAAAVDAPTVVLVPRPYDDPSPISDRRPPKA